MKALFKPSSKITDFGFAVRSLLFPERCALCGKLCDTRYFCKNCKDLPQLYKNRRCAKCGLPLKNCECSFFFYYFDKIAAPFSNEGAAQKAFYAFKFSGAANVASYFAILMAETVQQQFSALTFDVVTAVPMHGAKKQKRGYNQAEVLGKLVAAELQLPYGTLLRQRRKIKDQHFAGNVQERFENTVGKYAVISKNRLKGKTVLLVDDIKTTGATLSECARQLKLGGATAVYCVTALITERKQEEKEGN